MAAALFFLVMVNRASLGVAGPLAQSRFDVGPGALSVFIMLQIGIYAVLQVPAGVLVDRIGPRRTLVLAGVVNAAAQLLFGVSSDYPTALAARFVLGCGDALTFVSVLRVAAISVDKRRYPTLVALTQLVGLLGSLAATLPLLVLLRWAGWELTFCSLAIATGAAAAAVHLGRAEAKAPPYLVPEPVVGLARAARQAWQRPETRLAYWLQFSCMTTAMTFLLLWGFPYLTRGAGLSETAAGTVMLAAVLLSGAVLPAAGSWFSRRPGLRVPTVMGAVGGSAALWAVVLVLGGTAPDVVVAAAFMVSLVGVPAAGASFAIVRDGLDAAVVSTATGIVNAGGYLATVLACVGVGVVLQLQGGENPAAFRLALAVMVLIQVGGLVRARAWSRRFSLAQVTAGAAT